MGERIFVAIGEVLVAGLVAAIAMPVLWLIGRVSGLVPLLLTLSGGPVRLMFWGGFVCGALVGAIVVAVAAAALGSRDRLTVLLGAVGGAAGGVFSSVMFFPIVVFL